MKGLAGNQLTNLYIAAVKRLANKIFYYFCADFKQSLIR